MGNNEVGPVYSVPLPDGLPLPKGAMRQATPSRADLDSILDYRQGGRVVAGYEVLLWHYQRATRVVEDVRELASHRNYVDDAGGLHELLVGIAKACEKIPEQTKGEADV